MSPDDGIPNGDRASEGAPPRCGISAAPAGLIKKSEYCAKKVTPLCNLQEGVMIPASITKSQVMEAMRRISREGVPPQRNSRDYCLVEDGCHFPPKYTISLAQEIAAGRCLRSDEFSGGPESNSFLESCGFNVVECNCGGRNYENSGTSVFGASETRTRITATTRHSERCPACKIRVRKLLERIYGICLPNHRFRWPTDPSSYAGTSINSALRDVATVLEKFRGYGIGDFVRSEWLSPCDFFVPDPGFIVEFDESQHFTSPRKLALSVYADEQSLGFSTRRWISLCEHHNAKDNDPPFRDEQRAWYDALRDLVPSLKGMEPTVRLYARDLAWCSLDPDNRHDQQRFSALIRPGNPPVSRTSMKARTPAARTPSTLRVAMVFPEANQKSLNGVPPSGAGAQQPVVPTAASFAGEVIDFVLFPEGYICSSDVKRTNALKKLASKLDAPLLVGAIDRDVDSTSRAWQVLLRFDPDGSRSRIYTKHSTAKAVAFERQGWEPCVMLPTFELGSVSAGATICHDHYLGLLPRFLAKNGVHLWVNPSFDNVTEIKWSSVLRLRAVENRFFALCTLHCDVNRQKTHPFAFSPDGNDLSARQAGCRVVQSLSECRQAGNIYIVDLNMSAVGEPLDWSKLPPAKKQKITRNSRPGKPVRVALIDKRTAVMGHSGWQTVEEPGRCVETEHGQVYIGVVPEEQILDAAACFCVLDCAKQMKCAPIIWNHWNQLPTDSARLATLMMGRAIECCAPVLISDRDGIHELVELSNRNKIPARRTIETSGEAIVDIGYAWGLDNAFKMVTKHVPRNMKEIALSRYRMLAEPPPREVGEDQRPTDTDELC